MESSDKEGSKRQRVKKGEIEKQMVSPWENIGFWEVVSQQDKAQALKLFTGVDAYVQDHFFGDWCYNSSLLIGTCFFCWLMARMGGGLLSVLFILIFSSSVYRVEFRRLKASIKDDIIRNKANSRLEKEIETMEWLNSFLDKVWIIYVPALCEQIMFQANEVLKDQAPGFGIEKLSLDEFTLGSKAPRVESVKSYMLKGRDHIEMEWAFAFAPNDTEDMTKAQIRKKINPKVALGVTIGKAFISKSLPILVEDMSFKGRLNIKLKLNNNFPHIKLVSVQFLEPPAIDYALKPVGGDALGIDIMSFIPGLASFVNALIHANLGPMLYAPNSLDIDVEDIMSQQAVGSVGVLDVSIKRIMNLRPVEKEDELNPYVQIKVDSNGEVDERTKVKKSTKDPVFMETKSILVDSLDGNHLTLTMFNLKPDQESDKYLGSLSIPLADLLQKDTLINVEKPIVEEKKVVGRIVYDLRFNPILGPVELDDGDKVEALESELGILRLTLHEANYLDMSHSVVGLLNPYAEIRLNHQLVKTTRELRGRNQPTWDETIEQLIYLQSQCNVQILIKDAADDAVIAKLDTNLQDLVFESSRGQQWIDCSPISPSKQSPVVRLTAKWKPLKLNEGPADMLTEPPIGGLRLQIRSAKNLVNLEAVGVIDPYVNIKTGINVVGRTPTYKDTLSPNFHYVCFLPVANEHQHILLEIMDEEAEGDDKLLGTCAIHVNNFLKKNNDGYLLGYDGSKEVIEQPVLYNGSNQGALSYSVSFLPTLPVFTLAQSRNKEEYLSKIAKQDREEQERKRREEQLYKEKPNDYQWVHTEEDDLPRPKKQQLPLETLIKYRTGVMVVHVLGGQVKKQNTYLQVLFDDQAYPSGLTRKITEKKLSDGISVNGFIRDLPNSKLIFRLSKRFVVGSGKDIEYEKILPTVDIFKKSFFEPVTIELSNKTSFSVECEFIPSAVKLDPFDTTLDVGYLKLDILGAYDLMSADENGKSDPFLVVELDGVPVYKTDKKRRTLDPVWNQSTNIPILSRSMLMLVVEVFDWDLTNKPESLGRARLDLTSLDPYNSSQFLLKLDSQGEVLLRAAFKAEYIRPVLGNPSGLPIDVGAIGGASLKAVGNAGDFATGAISNGASFAGNGVGKGGSFVKGLGRKKSAEITSPTENSDSDPRRSVLSKRTGKSIKSPDRGGQEGAEPIEEGQDGEDGEGEEGEGEDGEEGEGGENEEEAAEKKKEEAELGDKDPAKNIKTKKARKEIHALPDIHPEMLPPPQKPIYGRPAGDEATITTSIAGTETIPGRINVLSASGFGGVPLDVKVLLETPSHTRTVYKTRSVRQSSAGDYHWNESSPFRSSSNGKLIFIVRESHLFSKSVNITTAVLPLEDAINKTENIVFRDSRGEIVVNLAYFEV